MNRTGSRLSLALAVALWMGAPLVSAQSWSAEQQEVWDFELAQWKRGAAKDLTWVEELVHPAALIWGNDTPGPQGKASIARWERYNSGNSTTLEQELFPLGIVVRRTAAGGSSAGREVTTPRRTRGRLGVAPAACLEGP